MTEVRYLCEMKAHPCAAGQHDGYLTIGSAGKVQYSEERTSLYFYLKK